MTPATSVRLLSRVVRAAQPCSQRWDLELDSLAQIPAHHSVVGGQVPWPLGASVSSAARWGEPRQLPHRTVRRAYRTVSGCRECMVSISYFSSLS